MIPLHINTMFNLKGGFQLGRSNGNSRLSIQGGHYSEITFIVRPLHIKLHFLHLYTFKICLKLHVCMLKILGLAMPIHMSTFHQDFPQLTFQQGGGLWIPQAPP